MKKYLYKTAWFIVPIALIVSFTEMFYYNGKGDMIRMAFLADTFNYNSDSIYKKDFAQPRKFTLLSGLDLTKKHKFKVMVIGDSFSDKNQVSYYNYLSDADSVLQVDRYINDNPLETLQGFLNAGLFNTISADYIILQSVEREIVKRRDFDSNKLINADTIQKRVISNKGAAEKKEAEENAKDELFSNKSLKFARNNILYLFDDNAFYSDTYKVATTKSLFDTDKNILLFYKDDIKRYDENANLKNIEALNTQLNALSDKVKSQASAKLIVLVAPDKLGLYHDHIKNKEKYKYSGFTKNFDALPKNYIYIPAGKILGDAVKAGEKDIYLFDDSHWSPIAARKIANAIDKAIK